MNSNRIIWRIAGAVAAVAVLILGIRQVRDATERRAVHEVAVQTNDGLVSAILTLLKKDPRALRPATRQAVEAVTRLRAQSGPATSEGSYALGLHLYYGLSDSEGAERAFRAAVTLKPEWSWPQNSLGILLFKLGREEEAMQAFQKAIQLDPYWSRPHSDMAILYRLAGRLDDAEREGLLAIEKEPENAAAQNNLGVILDMKGLADEARNRYEKAVDLDGTLPAPHYNLACGYARRGHANEAVRFLEEAVALEEAFREEARHDPDFDPIRGTAALEQALQVEAP